MLPEIGKAAPSFTANNQHGNPISLADFSGKKLVLYFYPKDDTPGCTAEACSLRDNYDALLAQGYAIVGVSPDDEKKHTKFITKYNLPFDLLADTDNTIALAYGVWVEKKYVRKKVHGDRPYHFRDQRKWYLGRNHRKSRYQKPRSAIIEITQ